jgi:hypothetical protein
MTEERKYPPVPPDNYLWDLLMPGEEMPDFAWLVHKIEKPDQAAIDWATDRFLRQGIA